MFYRRENGCIVGGPYDCNQDFPVDELPDDDAEVIAFMSPPQPKPSIDPALKKLAHFINAQFPNAPQDIKDLNGA